MAARTCAWFCSIWNDVPHDLSRRCRLRSVTASRAPQPPARRRRGCASSSLAEPAEERGRAARRRRRAPRARRRAPDASSLPIQMRAPLSSVNVRRREGLRAHVEEARAGRAHGAGARSHERQPNDVLGEPALLLLDMAHEGAERRRDPATRGSARRRARECAGRERGASSCARARDPGSAPRSDGPRRARRPASGWTMNDSHKGPARYRPFADARSSSRSFDGVTLPMVRGAFRKAPNVCTKAPRGGRRRAAA